MELTIKEQFEVEEFIIKHYRKDFIIINHYNAEIVMHLVNYYLANGYVISTPLKVESCCFDLYYIQTVIKKEKQNAN